MGDTASDPACRGAGKRGETVPVWHPVVREFSPFPPRYKAGWLLNANRRVENANAAAPASTSAPSIISDSQRRPRPPPSPRLSRRQDARITALRHRDIADQTNRSEEHTSELQSLMRNSYADFCLNKKKHQ